MRRNVCQLVQLLISGPYSTPTGCSCNFFCCIRLSRYSTGNVLRWTKFRSSSWVLLYCIIPFRMVLQCTRRSRYTMPACGRKLVLQNCQMSRQNGAFALRDPYFVKAIFETTDYSALLTLGIEFPSLFFRYKCSCK